MSAPFNSSGVLPTDPALAAGQPAHYLVLPSHGVPRRLGLPASPTPRSPQDGDLRRRPWWRSVLRFAATALSRWELGSEHK
ncbi:MAG TPA: hypothetical protein VG317_07580 [Pseudonocardiaceae bacterium]|jgi:hypothetical protein|nr:hypothetical protein [Pseudonocardiaceae bacterium]